MKKDPDDLPSELVEFEEVFSDINSPEIWGAQAQSDLSPKLIVLDGHSTVLVYTQESEELKWKAFNEIGQYEYIPDNIGDGLVNFPHTFYFEFPIELTDKKIHVNCTFDGTGVKALVMPMKDVEIQEFIQKLRERLSSLFSSVLKPNDDKLSVVAGETLILSEEIQSNLSLKLAFLGIDIKKLEVETITPYEPSEEEIIEEVFERPVEEGAAPSPTAPPPVSPPKADKPTAPPPVSPPKTDKTTAPPATPTTTKTPPKPPSVSKPTSKPPQAAEPASGPPPSPPPSTPLEDTTPDTAPLTKTGEPASPPSAAPAEKEVKPSVPPAPSSPPPRAKKRAVRSKQPPAAPKPTPSQDDAMGEVEEEEMVVAQTPAEKDELDLFATGMETEKQISLRHTHASYFERMVTNRAYPLVIRISTDEMKVRGSVTSQLTGERLSEKQEQISVEEDSLLRVVPEYPGCIVVPTYHEVDIKQSDVKVKFHITPLALGNLDAKVRFEQNNRTVHSMQLDTKVITHRISKWSAILGALGGSLPAFLAFTTGETPQAYLRSRFGDLGMDAFASLGYFFPVLLMSLLFGFAGFMYWFQKPQKRSRSVAFPR